MAMMSSNPLWAPGSPTKRRKTEDLPGINPSDPPFTARPITQQLSMADPSVSAKDSYPYGTQFFDRSRTPGSYMDQRSQPSPDAGMQTPASRPIQPFVPRPTSSANADPQYRNPDDVKVPPATPSAQAAPVSERNPFDELLDQHHQLGAILLIEGQQNSPVSAEHPFNVRWALSQVPVQNDPNVAGYDLSSPEGQSRLGWSNAKNQPSPILSLNIYAQAFPNVVAFITYRTLMVDKLEVNYYALAVEAFFRRDFMFLSPLFWTLLAESTAKVRPDGTDRWSWLFQALQVISTPNPTYQKLKLWILQKVCVEVYQIHCMWAATNENQQLARPNINTLSTINGVQQWMQYDPMVNVTLSALFAAMSQPPLTVFAFRPQGNPSAQAQ